MRRWIILFALAVFLLSGCESSYTEAPDSNQAINPPPILRSEVSLDLSKELQVLERPGEWAPLGIYGFLNKDLIVSDSYFLYWHTLGTSEFKLVSEDIMGLVASGNSLLMQGRYRYSTDLFVSEEDGVEVDSRQILKRDLWTGEGWVVDAKTVTSEDRPFVYLAKFDENRFLSAEINEHGSCVKLYNSQDDSFVELITSTHERINGDIQGRIIMDVCASDGSIYVLICTSGEELVYTIEQYDAAGTYCKTFDSPEAHDLLVDSAPLGIYSLGDYILLSNWNFDCGVYKVESDLLKEVVSPYQELEFFAGGMDNYYSDENSRYIYLLKNRTRYPGSTLLALDTETGNFKSLIFQSEDYPIIYAYQTDEHGNMIITWRKWNESGDGIDIKSNYNCYIPCETLDSLLEHAATVPAPASRYKRIIPCSPPPIDYEH